MKILRDESEMFVGPELAWVHPASRVSVDLVLSQDVTEEGRSEWLWLRLPNGDLMLGVFPRGATYESVEVDASYRETEAESLEREARQEAMLDASPILAEHRRLQGE